MTYREQLKFLEEHNLSAKSLVIASEVNFMFDELDDNEFEKICKLVELCLDSSICFDNSMYKINEIINEISYLLSNDFYTLDELLEDINLVLSQISYHFN